MKKSLLKNSHVRASSVYSSSDALKPKTLQKQESKSTLTKKCLHVKTKSLSSLHKVDALSGRVLPLQLQQNQVMNVQVLDQITENDRRSSRGGSSCKGLFKVDSSNEGSASNKSQSLRQHLARNLGLSAT